MPRGRGAAAAPPGETVGTPNANPRATAPAKRPNIRRVLALAVLDPKETRRAAVMAASHSKCPRATGNCGTSVGSGKWGRRSQSLSRWIVQPVAPAGKSSTSPAHPLRGSRVNRTPRWASKPFSRDICKPDRDGTLRNFVGFQPPPNNTPNAGLLEQPLQPDRRLRARWSISAEPHPADVLPGTVLTNLLCAPGRAKGTRQRLCPLRNLPSTDPRSVRRAGRLSPTEPAMRAVERHSGRPRRRSDRRRSRSSPSN